MFRVSRSLRRLNSLWTGPILALSVMVVLFWLVPSALAAPGNPAGVTVQSCAFGAGWTDGLSRWIFGASVIFLALAAVAGGMARSGGGGGGGEAVGGAISGVAGIGIVLGLLGAAGLLSGVAIAAAGGPAC